MTAEEKQAEQHPQSEPEYISVCVEFTGGLELLFGNVKKHQIKIPVKTSNDQPPNIDFLIHHLCDKHMKDPRREMFVLNGTVRPGILVLINDADWELEGEGQYEIKDNDNILFVSTLHGG